MIRPQVKACSLCQFIVILVYALGFWFLNVPLLSAVSFEAGIVVVGSWRCWLLSSLSVAQRNISAAVVY